MPELTPLVGIPIPLGPEGDDMPARMKEAFTVAEQSMVPKAVNTADRDSRYSGATVGQLVAGTTQSAVWYKTTGGAWVSRFTDTDWIPVTSFLSGWTAGQAIYYRVKDGLVHWEGALRPPSSYTEDFQFPVFNMPSAARPRSSRRWTAISDTGTPVALRYDGSNGQLLATITQPAVTAWISLPSDGYPVD